jgi:hypothetical protein
MPKLSVVLTFVETSMTEHSHLSTRRVVGPEGNVLTLADLPPTNTTRWVVRRKAELVAAVRGGLLSLDEACDRYALTVEEFMSWNLNVESHGLRGLRATKLQTYRRPPAGR